MTKSTCAPVSKSGRLYWAESAACLFWCCNDITVDRFNPCPILPRPFVYALSSLLGEEGRIMQRNNGAPLCQLAPIRRTYRLCQNRRRPNCSSMPLTWEGGVLYKRPQYSGTRHSTARCVIRPEGGWECLLYIWQHGSSCEESQCLVWGGGVLFRSERGTKRSHAPPQSHNDLQQRGHTTRGREQRAPSRKQHVACDGADEGQ